MRRETGFTLIEVLTAMMVGLLALGIIYSLIIVGRKSAGGVELKSAADQDVRAALEIMSMEIRMASFNPKHRCGIWKDSVKPMAFFAAYQRYKGIQEATPTALTIEMDINGNGIIATGANDETEVIRYEYVHTNGNQYMTRSTNGGGAQPFLGDRANRNVPKTVRVINGDALPIFQYFDAGGQLIDQDLASRLDKIRRIEITLKVETDEVSPDTGRRRQMTYLTSVIPRNHAIP